MRHDLVSARVVRLLPLIPAAKPRAPLLHDWFRKLGLNGKNYLDSESVGLYTVRTKNLKKISGSNDQLYFRL